MVRVAVFGTGRMGMIHIHNLLAIPEVSVAYVVSGSAGSEERIKAQFPGLFTDTRHGCRFLSQDDDAAVFADSSVEAVVIASPTSAHAGQMERALGADKAVFCEKPLAADLTRSKEIAQLAQHKALPLVVAFQRRFDPSFAAAKSRVESGEVGEVHFIRSCSRDPLKSFDPAAVGDHSIFLDSMVHDFDMLSWILGEWPVSVYSVGAVRGAGATFQGANWDVVSVTLQYPSGAIGTIDESRLAPHGYDQRLEILCERGLVEVANVPSHHCSLATDAGATAAPTLDYFTTRHRQAYMDEMAHFFAVLRGEKEAGMDGENAVKVAAVAEAAEKSLRIGVPVHPHY